MFDLASDAAMKQVLEGSVHRVSIHTRDLPFEGLFVLAHVISCVHQPGCGSPCQEVRGTPPEGEEAIHPDTRTNYTQILMNSCFLCVMKSLSRPVENTADLFTLDIYI